MEQNLTAETITDMDTAPISLEPISLEPISLEPISLESQFNNLYQDLTLLKSGLSDIFTKMRSLEKNITKELKTVQPKKKATTTKKQASSGFDKPAPITDELCKFMGLLEGSEISHTAVSQYIMNYTKTKKLIKNRSEIIPDEALIALFKLPPQDTLLQQQPALTLFNLPKHINAHMK